MRYSLPLLATVLMLASCSTLDDNVSLAGIRTEYDPHAVLSRKELRTVVKLANQCGVSQAAEVYTYNIHPSSDYGIGVKSVETMHGRDVSFVTLLVNRDGWIPKREEGSKPRLKEIGKFWVDHYGASSNKLTIFTVRNAQVRVHLSEGFPVPTADHIVEAFASGKIRYQEEALRDKLKRVDFSVPVGLGGHVEQNKFSISFCPSELVIVWVDFTLDAEGVTITGVHRVVS